MHCDGLRVFVFHGGFMRRRRDSDVKVPRGHGSAELSALRHLPLRHTVHEAQSVTLESSAPAMSVRSTRLPHTTLVCVVAA